jgi:DNA-binding winged helix-turn-helix (wHTH) protein
MVAHVVEAEFDPYDQAGPPAAAPSSDGAAGATPVAPPAVAAATATAAATGAVPVVGSAGVLVLLMSAASVEGLQRVAQGWSGPVLVVGSPEEAREVIAGEGVDVPGEAGADTPAPTVAQPAAPPAGAQATTPALPVVAGPGTVEGPPLHLDADRQVVVHRGKEAPLTPLEFGLLSALLARPGRVRRFEQLTQEVWGTSHVGDAAPVHSVVKRLRRKLEKLRAPVQLQAVRGIGFRLADRPVLSVVDR